MKTGTDVSARSPLVSGAGADRSAFRAISLWQPVDAPNSSKVEDRSTRPRRPFISLSPPTHTHFPADPCNVSVQSRTGHIEMSQRIGLRKYPDWSTHPLPVLLRTRVPSRRLEAAVKAHVRGLSVPAATDGLKVSRIPTPPCATSEMER